MNQLRYVLPLVCSWSSATHIWSQLFLAPSQKSLLCLNWDLTVISVFELHLFPLDFIYFLYQYLRLYICVWSPSIQIDFKFHKGSSHIYFISQGRFSTYHSAWHTECPTKRVVTGLADELVNVTAVARHSLGMWTQCSRYCCSPKRSQKPTF